MKFLLLAAGMGTRLKPLTDHVPKCLVPINGRPLLSIWLESLLKIGASEILINTHYKNLEIEEFILNSDYSNNVRLVYEPVLLGTAGTVANARNWIGDSDVFIAHADNLSVFDYSEFYERFSKRDSDTLGTLMTFTSDNPSQCGIVTVSDSNNKVLSYQEKPYFPKSNLANAAVYMFSRELMDMISSRPYYDLSKDFIAKNYNFFNSYYNSIYHRDIGTLESFALAQYEYRALKHDVARISL